MTLSCLLRKAFLTVTVCCFLLDGVPNSSADESTTLRLGYFPNVTHSQALIGLARGDFQERLGSAVLVKGVQFNAGPAVIEAIFAGEIDIAYVGPNPAVNGYVRSKGEALRIIAGATNGGAAFVLAADSPIRGAADLSGRRLATPQLGNTQDVALRSYLSKNGLSTIEKGGSVRIVPIENPQILDLLRQKEIDGAWVPEPWASRLVHEAGGKIFLDEKSLWPDGNFVTALIIARPAFLSEHRELVQKFLEAHVAVTEWEIAHRSETVALVNEQIGKLTGRKMPEHIVVDAFSRLSPTWDPLAASLKQCAESAFGLGFLKAKPDLSGIYALDLLNEVLKKRNQPAIEVVTK